MKYTVFALLLKCWRSMLFLAGAGCCDCKCNIIESREGGRKNYVITSAENWKTARVTTQIASSSNVKRQRMDCTKDKADKKNKSRDKRVQPHLRMSQLPPCLPLFSLSFFTLFPAMQTWLEISIFFQVHLCTVFVSNTFGMDRQFVFLM